MNNDNIRIPNLDPIISFHTVIRIEIKGRAPTNKGEKPYLPQSFFEYIQSLIGAYQRDFKDSFILVALDKNEVEP